MAAAPTSRFVLKFDSNIGRVVRLSIPRALPSRSAAATTEAMEAIIETGAVLVTNSGIPRGINGAKVVTTERRTIV